MSRYPWTPWTPPPSSTFHSSRHPPSRAASGSTSRTVPVGRLNASSAVPPRNKFEPYLMSMGIAFEQTTDAQLILQFREQGIPECEIPRVIKEYDARVDQSVAESCGESGEIKILGAKPNQGDTRFQVFPIPDTRLAIRIWDGGMEDYRQYFLDLYDLDKQIPVNSPRGCDIHYSDATPGIMPMAGGRHPSWENTFGVQSANIPPGEERYCVAEGSFWCLKCAGRPNFYFAVPLRKAQFAQFALPVDFQTGYH